MALVRTIAVIGAGISGRTIASAAALGGFHTILEDILPATLRKAEAEIQDNLDQPALSRIEYASTLDEAARQADLVIEAVPDELESKLEIFILLDKICRPHTLLALTSCTISVSDVASVTYRPQKCIGMRFSIQQHGGMRLELVRGEDTDEATLHACMEVGGEMNAKLIVTCETKPQRS